MAGTVKLPLGDRPRLVNWGLAEHGFHGQEEYIVPKHWCLHLYFYEVEMVTMGRVWHIVPGSLSLIPPKTKIVYKFTDKRCRHFFAHFGVKDKGPRALIPLLQHVPDGRDEILDRLQNIQRVLTQNALHAEILFWGLLWDIAEIGRRQPHGESRGISLLKTIEAFIEDRLPEKTTAAQVAEHMGLTTTHVNRIVKSHLGMTTIQLIKQRRLQRAYRFLLHSTMPIKLIAAECGIDDLQQFNKLMRSSYGKSPRQLRDQMPKDDESTWAIDRE